MAESQASIIDNTCLSHVLYGSIAACAHNHYYSCRCRVYVLQFLGCNSKVSHSHACFSNNSTTLFICYCTCTYIYHSRRCTEVGSRVAAYDLLVELSSGCYSNFELITTRLISMHHRPDPQIAKEWEVCVCWFTQLFD